jgi:hypothetical protein
VDVPLFLFVYPLFSRPASHVHDRFPSHELKVSISAGDKAKAQSIVADMQTKREALKRAADARAKKKAVSTAAFDDDCFSQDRKDAAVWHKTARKADDYFHDNAVEFW